jgi:putative ABC transport system substrate-binding protein
VWAFAQQQRTWRIGQLSVISRSSYLESGRHEAFLKALRDLGYVEGRNLTLEERYADGKTERLPALADELVAAKVDMIVTVGTNAGLAAKRATSTVPIVMAAASDPLASGLVPSLARPGGNITGLSLNATDIGPKNVELLLLAVPKLSRLAMLLFPDHPAHAARLNVVRSVAERANVTVLPVQVRKAEDFETGFARMKSDRADGLIVPTEALFFSNRRRLAELAAAHQLPSMFSYRDAVMAGGLMSYGTDLRDISRQAASYVDKILKGAKPGDLPVEEPSTLRLVLNRKTAQTLGVALSQELLLRVDEIIG